MVERPILFSTPMVRAILDGLKTMTRRVVNPQPHSSVEQMLSYHHPKDDVAFCAWGWWDGAIVENSDRVCPYGKVGDRLWVRETFAIVPRTAYRCSDGVHQTLRPDDDHDAAIYRAGWARSRSGFYWRPSIHMPRWASRLTLEITRVRIERLQGIGDDDAKAEGSDRYLLPVHPDCENKRYAIGFQQLWESINGRGSWAANPWVWVVEFKRVTH